MVKSYDASFFEESDDALCGYFSQQQHLLIRMGDGMVEKNGYAAPSGNPIEKFISVGINSAKLVKEIDSKSYSNNLEVIKDFATLGSFAVAGIFYGVAGEMYELCGEVGSWPEVDKLIDDIINERIKWNKEFFEDIDKEEFSIPVCTYKICVSRGSAGTIQISITDPWIDTEIKMHPTNIYRHSLKLSKSADIFKKGIGNITGGAAISHYFNWKFGRGMSVGTEIVTGATVGKYISTKLEKPISVVDYSFENATGTKKKP